MSGRLDFNPDPIKVVPDEQRDVWFKPNGWRCDYEDGRGRCTSRVTRTVWNSVDRRGEAFCEKHYSRGPGDA